MPSHWHVSERASKEQHIRHLSLKLVPLDYGPKPAPIVSQECYIATKSPRSLPAGQIKTYPWHFTESRSVSASPHRLRTSRPPNCG